MGSRSGSPFFNTWRTLMGKEDIKRDRDEMAAILADSLNKKNKGLKIAYFLTEDDNPSDIKHWVSTGSSLLDFIISNRKNGGAPAGRIVEFNGLEGSGKSLVGAHLLAETQKLGGTAVYVDTENAVSSQFLKAIGVDLGNMIYVPTETVEDIFETIESIIFKIRENDKDRVVTILIDSLAGASTNVEMDADFNQAGWATQKAIVISKAMRKLTNLTGRERILLVFTNQLRDKLDAGFGGDKYTTSGGKALPFHASTRVRLTRIGQIKQTSTGGDVIGIKVKAKIVKNRMGPPLREAIFDVYFDRGIDDLASWLQFFKDQKIIKSSGAWYTLENFEDEPIKFQGKHFKTLLEEKEGLKDYLYDKMGELMVREYREEEVQKVIDEDSDIVQDLEVADEIE